MSGCPSSSGPWQRDCSERYRPQMPLGWSQKDFALEAGLARSYYSGIERGHRNLAAVNLTKIALTLEVEVGALFPDTCKLRQTLQKSARR
ncbi:MAG: helix-turn-helix domain-containing protein [Panacagrimonas sp.]